MPTRATGYTLRVNVNLVVESCSKHVVELHALNFHKTILSHSLHVPSDINTVNYNVNILENYCYQEIAFKFDMLISLQVNNPDMRVAIIRC